MKRASSASAAAAWAARATDPEEAIRLTLATFTAAFRSLDVPAVQRVFPSASADELKQTFVKLAALDRQLEVISVQVGTDAQFAMVHAKIEDVARLKTGTTERATTMARFVMVNNRSSWIIQGAEFEPIKK
jgi:ketosteroid isomerase-like protein